MRILCSILSLVFTLHLATAQSIQIPVKLNTGIGKTWLRTLVIPNEAKKEFCLLLVDRSKMLAFRISDDFKLLDQAELGSPWALAHLMGGTNPINDRYVVFLRDDKGSPAVMSIDFDQEKGRIDGLSPLNKQYTLLGGLTIGGLHNMVYVSKKMPSEIKVLQYKNEINYEEINFNIPELANFKTITSKSSCIDVPSIYYNFLRSSQATTKLYPDGKDILITSNYNTKTKVIRLDLATAKSSVIDYPLPFITGKEGNGVVFGGNPTKGSRTPDKGNSFYYDGYLVQGNCNLEKLRINITDLATGEIIKDLLLTADDSTFVKHTPFNKYVLKMNAWQNKELEAKAFLRYVSNRGLGITLNKEKNDLTLTAGIFYTTSSTGHYSPGTPGGTISTPYGNVSTPGTPGTFSGGGSTASCAYFKTVLSKDKLEPIPQNFNIGSRATREHTNEPPHGGTKVLFYLNGETFTFTYDKANKFISISKY